MMSNDLLNASKDDNFYWSQLVPTLVWLMYNLFPQYRYILQTWQRKNLYLLAVNILLIQQSCVIVGQSRINICQLFCNVCQHWSVACQCKSGACQRWSVAFQYWSVACQHWLIRVKALINCVNIGTGMRCASFPPPSSYPPSLVTLPCLPQLSPSSEAAVRFGMKMGSDSSTSGGSRQQNNTCLTAMPSAASRILPIFHSVISRHLEQYLECVDNAGQVRKPYDVHGRMKRLSFFCKIPLAAPASALPPSSARQPGPPLRSKEASKRKEVSMWLEAEKGLGWEEACQLPALSPLPSYCGGRSSHSPCYPYFPSSLHWRC